MTVIKKEHPFSNTLSPRNTIHLPRIKDDYYGDTIRKRRFIIMNSTPGIAQDKTKLNKIR